MDELATVACYVVSLILATAGCERNWILFGSVTGGRHGRLSPEEAAKLVYVRADSHLLHREFLKGQEDNEGEGFAGDSDDDIIRSDSEIEDYGSESEGTDVGRTEDDMAGCGERYTRSGRVVAQQTAARRIVYEMGEVKH
ncbi:unnamed protein product, partial [Laminaria digitata]